MEKTPHERWVEAGHCPSISSTKAWCNFEAGHHTNHMAPYLHPGGKKQPLWWTDKDRTPRSL
jgi:hypothetical protein